MAIKKVIILLLLCAMCLEFACLSFAAECPEKEWGGSDKLLHFTVSCGISLLAYRYNRHNTGWLDSQARAAAFFTTLAIGTAKEFVDEEFDWKDMEADAMGAALGIGMTVNF